jgi:hypothetical protein
LKRLKFEKKCIILLQEKLNSKYLANSGGKMAEEQVGCARPTGSVVGEKKVEKSEEKLTSEEAKMDVARVGAKAPDFEAPAFFQGEFVNIKLSDYLGKWVLLCFYPGDFTFV